MIFSQPKHFLSWYFLPWWQLKRSCKNLEAFSPQQLRQISLNYPKMEENQMSIKGDTIFLQTLITLYCKNISANRESRVKILHILIIIVLLSFQISLNKDDIVQWKNTFLLFLNSQINCWIQNHIHPDWKKRGFFHTLIEYSHQK